jgi:hypothetical protein
MQPPARRDRGETGTPRAARATRPPFPATAGGGPAPGAQACATIGALPSLRDLHAPYGSRGATALPGHGQRRACATRTCVCRHRRVAIAARPARPCGSRCATALPGYSRQRASAWQHMCVPPSARRHRGETCTARAARAARPPSPATAGGVPAQGSTCVRRHRRVAIAARPARPVRLSRRDRPPQPRPAEDRRRAAHVCAAIGVPPLWRTCTPRAARATRPPSPATAAKGPAPGSTCVFRHQSVAISASRARPMQLTRRDRPPRPRPTEGKCRAAHACTAIGASRSRRDAIAEGRASRLSAASVLPPPARHDRARRARQVLSALCSRPPQQRWWRAAPHGGTECHCRRVAIKRDEHAQCRQCSAVALPSRTGGGQCNMAASGVAAGASRSRETSTPRVVHALQSSSPAVLVEGSIALQHRVPLPARRDSARRARAVSSALCRLSPQPGWRRAVPHGCVRCCNLRFAVARDKHAKCRLRSAGALPG